ncbi:MAG TPA: XRE family transcriptional regulator [Thermomicrobiales bacterium]|nr:XRE family transcriptional regulator [Thermomicrobiales bacterium]
MPTPPGQPIDRSSQRLSNGLEMADLGERIRAERTARGLSLDGLAGRSGVSRSMLSAVENGDKVPTILILDRIAAALGTSIARLLDDEEPASVIVRRHAEQDVTRDPSGWERRILSPVVPGVEFEFMRATIDPGVDAGAFSPHGPDAREYIAVERGTLQLTLDGVAYTLEAGDSISYDGDCVHAVANPGESELVYYVAMVMTEQPGARPTGSSRRPEYHTPVAPRHE